MSFTGKTPVTVILLAIAGVLILFYYNRPIQISVQAIQASTGIVEKTVSNTRAGSVKACRRARLSTSTGGQIEQLLVHEGDRVKKNDVLLTLWNLDLLAEQQLTLSQIQAAQSNRQASCLQADVALREANRLKKLQHSGAVSEEQIDKADIEARARQAACESATASIQVAMAQSSVVQAKLERTRLTAPFDGIIAEVNGEVSEYLTPSPPGIPTPPAIDLIDPSCFYVSAPIDEVDAANIKTGQPARISLDAFEKRRFDGQIKRIAAYVLDLEKQARTVEIEVHFTDPQAIQLMLAGYSADVEIILQANTNVLRIPSTAFVEENSIYIFNYATGLIEKRGVSRGLSNWDFTEISDGLSAGEWVVTSIDTQGLADGAAAELVSSGND